MKRTTEVSPVWQFRLASTSCEIDLQMLDWQVRVTREQRDSKTEKDNVIYISIGAEAIRIILRGHYHLALSDSLGT